MQKILAELSAAVGPGQAIEICRRWPGRRLQVPTQVEDGDPLVLSIGMDVARELVRRYGGRRLELPTERNALRSVRDEAIRRDRAAGMSHERLGAAYGLTRQAVAHILKKSIPRTDGESDALPALTRQCKSSRRERRGMRMLQQLEKADTVRRMVAPRTAQKHKAALGQFMTPSSVARFMASMFPASTLQTCRLLDAGAGVGALSCAFLDRWLAGGFGFKGVEATAYEVDEKLRGHLKQHLANYSKVKAEVIAGDYIELATAEGLKSKGYTHAILNPPYKKIHGQSAHRLALRRAGIETVNLYSAFVALAVAEAAPGGQVVAIIPRSFCNGPYYRPFRDFILERAAIRHMHLFESRSKAFKDDEVLQENIIIRLERGGQQGPVTVSTSTDDSFSDLTTHEHPFDRIVFPDDPERFIHVPTTTEKSTIELSPAVCYSLADIGVKVSTGPVVDFRLKAHLRDMPEPGAVPLIYPGHLSMTGTVWPVQGLTKSSAIMRNDETEKWLYPNGFYCVVRRFSSKEEKRRIVASIVDPAAFGDHSVLGFENHLNLFHENKHGLPEALARGLAVFLNTTAVDEHFRRFNGHTQVNATDLKLMKYPSRDTLIQLGEWAMKQGTPTQDQIDAKLGTLTTRVPARRQHRHLAAGDNRAAG